ncbi:MAG: hypothetical protein KQH63_04330 [Desulfobulbaceae bacterium]|nr:hypothetical protein [Desulfobulbaceae bacterium]
MFWEEKKKNSSDQMNPSIDLIKKIIDEQANDPFISADFNQSGKIRSDYRSFLHKYIVAISSTIVSFFGLYILSFNNDKLITNELCFGVIILGFIIYYILILGVNFYTDQVLTATHHIRNQATHRSSSKFNYLLALQNVKLFTRSRSIGKAVKYFIPHWTTRNEFSLVVGMIIASFIPILSTYFYWNKIDGISLYQAITGLLLELVLALWILEKKILTIFAPLVESRIVSPENPVPVMTKSPTGNLPPKSIVNYVVKNRTYLFWSTLLCFLVILFSIIYKFEWYSKVTIPIIDDIALIIASAMPYFIMFYLIASINNMFFDGEMYVFNKVNLISNFLISLMISTYFLISMCFAIFSFLSFDLYYLETISIIMLGLISFKVKEIYLVNNEIKKRKKYKVYMCLWLVFSFFCYSIIHLDNLKGKLLLYYKEGLDKFIDNSLIYFNLNFESISVFVPLLYPLIVIVIYTIFFMKKKVAGRIFTSAALLLPLSFSLFNVMNGFIPFTLTFCFLTFLFFSYFSYFKGENKFGHWHSIALGFIFSYVFSLSSDLFTPIPWVVLIFVPLVFFLAYNFIFRRYKKAFSILDVLFFTIPVILLGVMAKIVGGQLVYDMYSSNRVLLPGDLGLNIETLLFLLHKEPIPLINLILLFISSIITFFICISSWFFYFDYTDFTRDINFSFKRWPKIKFRIDRSKQKVFSFIKIVIIILISYPLLRGIEPNFIFYLLVTVLIFSSLSCLLFQTELLFASAWKTEFQGMHLLVDSIFKGKKADSEINHIFESLEKHGVKGEFICSFLHNRAKEGHDKTIQPVLLRVLRENIDESFILLLKQRLLKIFNIEHKSLLPSTRRMFPDLVNADNNILVSRFRYFDVSNLLITGIRSLLLTPWFRELSAIYDQLGQPQKLWRNRAELFSNTAIHSSNLIKTENSHEITVLLSSDSVAGQEKLVDLATNLIECTSSSGSINQEYSGKIHLRFVALNGGHHFSRKGVPYLYSDKEESGAAIGILDTVPKMIKQLVKLYPVNKILRLQPDLIVLSDSSFTNTELSKFTQKYFPQIPVIYYVPPQAELYSYLDDNRICGVLENCNYIFTITYYQQKLYKQCLDKLLKKNNISPPIVKRISFPQIYNLYSELNEIFSIVDRRLDSKVDSPVYGFLPGSRSSEWEWSFRLLNKLIEMGEVHINVLFSNRKALKKFSDMVDYQIDTEKVNFYIDRDETITDSPDRFSDWYNLENVTSVTMGEFLTICHRIISVSGTAATEASYVRPVQTLYYLSRSIEIMAELLNFSGKPKDLSGRKILDYLQNDSSDPCNENANWWHFSLVNWLIMKTASYEDDDFSVIDRKCRKYAKDLRKIMLKEKLIFWEDISLPDYYHKKALEIINDNTWSSWGASEMHKVRYILNKTLLSFDDENKHPLAPNFEAATKIYEEIILDS